MKRTTKGAIAAAAAAVLLLGGAGSLAYWTADGDVNGGTITAGNINLSALDCDDDWTFTEGAAGTLTKIVPGDVVEKNCTATLTGEGDHLEATIEIDPTTVSNQAFGTDGEELVVTADLTSAAGPVAISSTPTPVAFTITVAFPYGGPVSTPDPETDAKNGSQDATATLDAIRVVAVQVHP